MGELITSLLKSLKIETIWITARYNRSINELVKAAKFDGRVANITDERFPEQRGREKKKEATLLHFNVYVTIEAAEAVMKRLRLRHGTIKELLSVAIDHPGKQQGLPIVAAGSICQNSDDRLQVPYLWGGTGGWCLSLDWRVGYGWRGDCLFLAVSERNNSPS